MFNNQKGFTLIELMVVVVIIGILAAIALPNFLSMQDRAKESEVKSNAHTIQLSVEDFKTQSNGNKPLGSGSFATGATIATVTCGIPATLKNSFVTNLTGKNAMKFAASTAVVAADRGQVNYEDSNSQIIPYYITGVGKTGNRISDLTEGQ